MRYRLVHEGAPASRRCRCHRGTVESARSNDVAVFLAQRTGPKCLVHCVDFGIVGCDDVDFAELLDPPLTTISVPAVEMGALAVIALWKAMSSGKAVKGKLVPTTLKVRGSTAPPR